MYQPTLDFNITDRIEEYSLKKQREQDKERKEKYKGEPTRFYPSSIGFCSRRIVMQALDYERPELPAKVLRIMENGTYMHERFEAWFEGMGILIAPEVPIKDKDLRISGRTDALIRVPGKDGTGKIVLVELKSANDKQFNRMMSQDKPKDEHLKQIQLYMHLTGIEDGLILVENKNNQDLWEYWCKYDPIMASELIEKIKMVNSHIDAEILPNREFDKTSFECRYCDFRNECWK